jgi:hypothetical protein
MIFGGTFEPAYILSIFALPSQLLPTTNKRNAALIQKHVEETLGVPPARGFLRFVPTQEEHLACNGKTMAGEIDELERSLQSGDDDEGAKPSPVTIDEVVAGAITTTTTTTTTRMRARRMLSVKVTPSVLLSILVTRRQRTDRRPTVPCRPSTSSRGRRHTNPGVNAAK